MATKMLQTSEAFIAGLTWVRPLPSVTAQVTLQVCLPLHCVCTKGAFEAHNRVRVCKRKTNCSELCVISFISLLLATLETYSNASKLMMKYLIPPSNFSKGDAAIDFP